MRTNCDQNATIQRLTVEVDALREEVSNLKQENRRIRRRLQGAAAPKPPMEALHFSRSIDQGLFLLRPSTLLSQTESVHRSSLF